MAGTLYLVATPIGNLEDITPRAIRTLSEVDLIACEDTRLTRRLLSRHRIETPLISYHEHNERSRSAELVTRLQAGENIAVVTDAGMPCISDPGVVIVSAAAARGIRVVPLPGPSALVTALAASGLPTDDFYFAGFLPSKRSARRARIEEFRASHTTVVVFEAPHRIGQSLADIKEILGDLPAAIARELSKVHEEFLRGRLSDLLCALSAREPRGEFVVLFDTRSLQAKPRPSVRPEGDVRQLVDRLISSTGISRMEAIKQVARTLQRSKKSVYDEDLALRRTDIER